MTNTVCISPLKFYDSLDKQARYKSYAYGHIVPVITNPNVITPFYIYSSTPVTQLNAILYNANTGRIVARVTQELEDLGLIYGKDGDGWSIMYRGVFPIAKSLLYEGYYYLGLKYDTGWLYSEVFCYTNDTSDLLEIEYWNPEGNIYLAGKYPLFPNDKAFHYKLLLKTELGKPEYSFEEEATTRLGYSFVESQVSKKTYKFNIVVPEFMCDAMRIIRLCSKKLITCKGETYDAINFNMEVEWQEQGDLASVNCSFDVDNVIVNLGGFKAEQTDADFNNDFNDDFNNE